MLITHNPLYINFMEQRATLNYFCVCVAEIVVVCHQIYINARLGTCFINIKFKIKA